jgi:hypothetical protein
MARAVFRWRAVKIDHGPARFCRKHLPQPIPSILTMSASPSSAAFPTSALDVCSGFVLDRVHFLDQITDAVNVEDSNCDAEKMLSLLQSNQLINIVGRCLSDASKKINRKALLALGNLMASDNAAVAADAHAVAMKALDPVLRDLGKSEKLASGVSFVLRNLAKFAATDDDVPQKVPAIVSEMISHNESVGYDDEVLIDLLWAAIQLQCFKQIDTGALLTILYHNRNNTTYPALSLLGDQLSEDTYAACYHHITYDVLRDLLLNERGRSILHLALWCLTNLVVEGSMGLRFLQDEELLAFVANLAECSAVRKAHVAREAMYVLANAIAKTNLAPLFEDNDELRDSLYTTLQKADAQCLSASDHKALTEAITKVGVFYEVETEEETEEVADEEATTIADEDEEEVPTYPDLSGVVFEIHNPSAFEVSADDKNVDNLFASLNLPCERPSPNECIFNQCLGTYFPQNALSIITHINSSYGTSKTVFDLITRVSNNNGAFTPIEDNVTLTIKDLKDLEIRGYVVMRGCVGINPAITKALYPDA